MNIHYLHDTYGYARTARFDEPLLIRVVKAMMICAGADGLSPAELEYSLAVAICYGASPEALEELRRFDFEHAKLEDYLKNDDRVPKRALLYDAIRVSHADGVYAEAERAAVRDAADLLGIDEPSVIALEGMVELEAALRKARVRLIHQG